MVCCMCILVAYLIKHVVGALGKKREIPRVDIRRVERLPGAPPVLILHPGHKHARPRVRERPVVIQEHSPDVVEVRVGDEDVRDGVPRDAAGLEGGENAAEAGAEVRVRAVPDVEEDAVSGVVLQVKDGEAEGDDLC